MYQYPRESPLSSSPARSPQTNPSRTNNQRDQAVDRGSSFDFLTSHERMAGEQTAGPEQPAGERSTNQSKDAGKLRQVIQHFFTKAALTIISSRVNLPQAFYRDSNQIRSNKWFNLVLDETDALTEDLHPWMSFDLADYRPPSLIIEIYLDTTELTRNQTLVIVDERGKKWDVCEALSSPINTRSASRTRQDKTAEVVLERWKVYLDDPSSELSLGSTDSMPNIYKKAVVLFRSLYTYTRFLPAWKFGRQIAKQPASLSALRPMYRILDGRQATSSRDTLGFALYPTAEHTTETYHFANTHSPAGPLSIKVSYRVNCDFRVVSSEALLSSQLMGVDDGEYFQPSLGDARGEGLFNQGGKEIGSLPVHRRGYLDEPDRTQAYGSMSTFHQVGPATGTSPMSALRAARDIGAESPPDSLPQKTAPRDRTSQGSKSSLKSIETGIPMQRRVSVSFQPFKAGSLSSSPAAVPVSPGPTPSRPSSISSQLAQARSRTSQITLPQAALRVPLTPTGEAALATPSPTSPKPASVTRYSSSFGHRRSRMSSGGGSKADEDNTSSGKASMTSSNHQGSDGPAEGEAGSSGSVATDDDNISDFIKLLEQKKDLRSFSRSDDAARDASTRRTAAALSKYQRMRDSHAALTDSLSSSMMLHRSSSSSSRQLSSIPPMVPGTSVSTSSSPGKPVSPHTPHTPAIPSRLSARSNIDDPEPRRSHGGSRTSSEEGEGSTTQDNTSDVTTRERGTTAIDIPTSPGVYPRIRRSSSVAQRQPAMEDEYGMRSASLPGMSLSEMLVVPESLNSVLATNQRADRVAEQGSQEHSQRFSTTEDSSNNHHQPHRPRIGRGSGGRGGSSAEGSSSSLGTASRTSERAGRMSFGARVAAHEDEEPLLFMMSELGNQSRRSLEDGKSASDSTPSASRGSRRGGAPYT